jgi:hypothetical protein
MRFFPLTKVQFWNLPLFSVVVTVALLAVLIANYFTESTSRTRLISTFTASNATSIVITLFKVLSSFLLGAVTLWSVNVLGFHGSEEGGSPRAVLAHSVLAAIRDGTMMLVKLCAFEISSVRRAMFPQHEKTPISKENNSLPPKLRGYLFMTLLVLGLGQVLEVLTPNFIYEESVTLVETKPMSLKVVDINNPFGLPACATNSTRFQNDDGPVQQVSYTYIFNRC